MMKRTNEYPLPDALETLCASVRALVGEQNYEESMRLICQAMESYPHAPQPHNLLGIVLEKRGDHLTAMKHFRAAWALDPTYAPANHNLHTYGTFFSDGGCAFDESDLPVASRTGMEATYDRRSIGRAARRTRIRYDEYGIGHVVRR